MKKRSPLLAIMEMQIKMRDTTTHLLEWLKLIILTIPRADKRCQAPENLTHTFLVGMQIDTVNSGKWFEISLKS